MGIVFRTIIMYVFLLAALRIMGKREFGQLSALELVTLMLIPELMQQALIHDDYSMTNAIVGACTLLTLTFATSLVMHRSKRAEKLLDGEPVVLVQFGHILEDAMNRERVTPDEILAEMHRAGLYDLGQVRWAILQTDGKIAIVPRDGLKVLSTADDSAAI